MNASSSFSIKYTRKDATSGGEQLVKTGKLHLVHLAGNENLVILELLTRASRMLEISISPCWLWEEFAALVEIIPHVLYRESKLIRILQRSWGCVYENIYNCKRFPASLIFWGTCEYIRICSKNKLSKPGVDQKPAAEPIKDATEAMECVTGALDTAHEKMECASLKEILKSHEWKINCSENKLLNWYQIFKLLKKVSVLLRRGSSVLIICYICYK